MGMWIILIGDETLDFNKMKSMSFGDCIRVAEHEEKQVDIFFKDGYVSFQNDYDEVIKNDYSLEELASLPYKKPTFYFDEIFQSGIGEVCYYIKRFSKKYFARL